jgi:hypothetical protein
LDPLVADIHLPLFQVPLQMGDTVTNPTPNKIESLTFAQYLTRVALRLDRTARLRAGQVYYIELQELDPDWAMDITVHSPELDPFHDDRKIGIFLNHVCEMWGRKGGVVFTGGTPTSKGRPC